jgi:hypothetical protein
MKELCEFATLAAASERLSFFSLGLMPDAHDTVVEKVATIFRELVGDRAERLQAGIPPFDALHAFEQALVADYPADIAPDLAFHLADVHWDAAFLVAAYLFPERFTHEELAAGVGMLLCHAPNYLAAAATLALNPVRDIFEVGVAENPPEQT